MTKRVVLYARISIATEQSVSVERQLQAGRSYCEARGWAVVAEFVDSGVSASKTKPEDRAGWRALLDSEVKFDAALVWKTDRLARRVLDFLHADEALQARGAGLVAVEDPVDMTTPQGRAFATILAVFGQMEADAISARVRDARRHLIASGRVTGGRLPYGWTSEVRDGGRYLVQDPERIEFVKAAAQMILEGRTVKAVCAYLDEQGAPLPPSSARKGGGWHHSTVSGLLRNPVLWGGTLDNPGNGSKERGPQVRRDANGLPTVNAEVAIMSPAEHRHLVSLIDSRERPRSEDTATSPLFSHLVTCGECDVMMHRSRKAKREVLVCPSCWQSVGTRQFGDLVAGRLLAERGDQFTFEITEEDRAPELGEIEAALSDLSTQLTEDGADVPALVAQIEALKALRAEARTPDRPVFRFTPQRVSEAWEAAADDMERRDVLAGQLASLKVFRGKVGRLLDPARVAIEWKIPPEVNVDHVGTIAELSV